MKTRIITGKYKGRVLQLPPTETARPTRNRILQAAFNILSGYTDFTNATVMDLCCGSGAWGLEALSRGAAHATFIDTDTRTVQANLKALGLESQATVQKTDASRYTPSHPANLIFADPPYAATHVLQGILGNATKIGQPGSLWLIETAATATPIWPKNLQLLETRTYGVSALHLLRMNA